MASNGTSGGEPAAGAALWLGVEPPESVAPSFLNVKKNGGSRGCPRGVYLYSFNNLLVEVRNGYGFVSLFPTGKAEK